MQILDDTTFGHAADLGAGGSTISATSSRGRRATAWWYAAIVTLDTLAILAFITWVVIPKLT